MALGGARPGAGRPRGSTTRPAAVRAEERIARAERKQNRMAAAAEPSIRHCADCATPFRVDQQHRKFCSDACKTAGYRLGSPRPCPTCGIEFRPNKFNGQIVCSLACRRYPEARLWPSDQEAHAAAADRRRVRKFGSGYERFWRRTIFERDGWNCLICGFPVDRSEKPDKHLRPSLDHKVPLAKDGAHSRENVQCAHWICNSRKTHSLDGGTKAAELMKVEYATRWSAAGCRPETEPG